MVLAVAVTMLTVHVMAQGTSGYGAVDILGKDGGIFETDGSAFSFPEFQDTSINTVTVGDDRALAFGNIWQKSPLTTAMNNLEVKINQDSGECVCCDEEIDTLPLPGLLHQGQSRAGQCRQEGGSGFRICCRYQ